MKDRKLKDKLDPLKDMEAYLHKKKHKHKDKEKVFSYIHTYFLICQYLL